MIFEEIDQSANIIQIYPWNSVDPDRTYSILKSRNREGIYEIRSDSSGHVIYNITLRRAVGRVQRVSRTTADWELVSGELYDRMQRQMRDWASSGRAQGYVFPVHIHFK